MLAVGAAVHKPQPVSSQGHRKAGEECLVVLGYPVRSSGGRNGPAVPPAVRLACRQEITAWVIVIESVGGCAEAPVWGPAEA